MVVWRAGLSAVCCCGAVLWYRQYLRAGAPHSRQIPPDSRQVSIIPYTLARAGQATIVYLRDNDNATAYFRASVTRKNMKNVKASVSKRRSHNEYSHNVKANMVFVAAVNVQLSGC